jgi:thioredoxin-like negative regulator of GroEL
MNETLLRLIWAAAILGVGIGLYWAANRWTLARSRLRVRQDSFLPKGKPVILYFSTPTCMPCKTIQRPALQRLKDQAGEKLQVVEIDASQQPEVANRWGVLSVPTTFIIDGKGNPKHVNHGVAPLEKLQKQLKGLL